MQRYLVNKIKMIGMPSGPQKHVTKESTNYDILQEINSQYNARPTTFGPLRLKRWPYRTNVI